MTFITAPQVYAPPMAEEVVEEVKVQDEQQSELAKDFSSLGVAFVKPYNGGVVVGDICAMPGTNREDFDPQTLVIIQYPSVRDIRPGDTLLSIVCPLGTNSDSESSNLVKLSLVFQKPDGYGHWREIHVPGTEINFDWQVESNYEKAFGLEKNAARESRVAFPEIETLPIGGGCDFHFAEFQGAVGKFELDAIPSLDIGMQRVWSFVNSHAGIRLIVTEHYGKADQPSLTLECEQASAWESGVRFGETSTKHIIRN